MNKVIGSALGVVVAVGALSTAGAWFTGQQIPTVLDNALQQANDDLTKSLPATGFAARIELLSLERHLFSSDARYRIQVTGSLDGEASADYAVTVKDRIEHGPFPLSRLSAFKLLPVMASSHFELERSPELETWFAASQNGSPLQGQVSLGYDEAVSGYLRLQPVQVNLDEQTRFDFSGLNVDFDTSANAEQIIATGLMDSLQIHTQANDETLRFAFSGMSLNSNTRKGSGDFYLGGNEVRLQQIEFQVGDHPPVLLKDFVQRDETTETNQQLSVWQSYDVGMISYQGTDIGSSQLLWRVKNLDVMALQSLVELYGTLLQDGKLENDSGMPELSDAQTAQLKVDLEKLLAGKPGIALEKLAFKTANGESSFSLGLDFNKPSSFDLPAEALAQELITQLDAQLRVSKAMISDVVSVQAKIAGETDQQAIAQQAAMVGEMASGMALASELATLEGETIRASLNYAGGQVTFNGKPMSVEQFMALAMSSAGGLGAMGGTGDDEALMDDSEGYSIDE